MVMRVAMLCLLLNCVFNAFGQEAEKEQIKYRNTLAAGVAVGEVISESGDQTSFSMGFDYLYRLDSKWEVGTQIDLNYSRSFEHHESDAIVPIVAYSVTNRLPVFVGVGLERERSTGHTAWLARVSLLPGAFVDFIDGERVFSAVLAIGFVF